MSENTFYTTLKFQTCRIVLRLRLDSMKAVFHVISLTHILLLTLCSIFFSISFFFLSFSYSLMDGWSGIDGRRPMIIFSEMFKSNLHTSWSFIHKNFNVYISQNVLLCNDNTIIFSKFNTNLKLILSNFYLIYCLYFNVECQPKCPLQQFIFPSTIHSGTAPSILSLQSHLTWNTFSAFVFYDTFLKEHGITFLLNRNTAHWALPGDSRDQIRG